MMGFPLIPTGGSFLTEVPAHINTPYICLPCCILCCTLEIKIEFGACCVQLSYSKDFKTMLLLQ